MKYFAVITEFVSAVFILTGTTGPCAYGLSASPPKPSGSMTKNAPALTRTVVLENLRDPWDMAFFPDGTMLFTEKCRGLSVRRSDGQVGRLFGSEGSSLEADDLFCQSQSGMLGVAIDPGFEKNRFIYVFMASKANGKKSNHVVRLTLDKNYAKVGDRRDIVTDIPFKTSANRWGPAGIHSGGRIRFGPKDGFLYIATGDNHNGPLPQDLSRLGGKVLRVDRGGKAVPDNQVPAGGDARIFTYGHRNVQGLAFQPGSGRPFACEHGPGHSDEVTPLTAGGNGGWDPKPAEGVACGSNYCGYVSNRPDGKPTSMTDIEKFPKALKPSWNNGGVSEGMSPCIFLAGKNWRDWEGRLAVGFLRGARIELLEIDNDGTAKRDTAVLDLPKERMRSLVQGPDGALYVAVDGGEIWRLTIQ